MALVPPRRSPARPSGLLRRARRPAGPGAQPAASGAAGRPAVGTTGSDRASTPTAAAGARQARRLLRRESGARHSPRTTAPAAPQVPGALGAPTSPGAPGAPASPGTPTALTAPPAPPAPNPPAAPDTATTGGAGASVERLSAPARMLVVGVGLSALGNGLTLPFLLIYLHRVRHIGLDATGGLLGLTAVVGLAAAPLVGTVADRVGPRRVLLAALSAAALGWGGVAAVRTVAVAVPVAVLIGLANSGLYQSQANLFSRLAHGRAQERLFALQFSVLNAGIGVGGLLAGAVVRLGHPGTFQAVYLADAATFVVFAALVVVAVPAAVDHADPAPSAGGPPAAPGAPDAGAVPGGYRVVWADRSFRRLLGLSGLLALAGYTQLDSGTPAFVTEVLHRSPQLVAWMFVANTAVIVAGQLVVLRWLRGVRRSSAIAGTGAVWAGSWLLLGVAGRLGHSPVAAVLVVVFGATFAVGETLLAPTMGPLLNDVAPAHLRGRYNAAASLTYMLGGVLAPPIATSLIAAHRAVLWVGGVAGLAVAAGVGAARSRHWLPAHLDTPRRGTPRRDTPRRDRAPHEGHPDDARPDEGHPHPGHAEPAAEPGTG